MTRKQDEVELRQREEVHCCGTLNSIHFGIYLLLRHLFPYLLVVPSSSLFQETDDPALVYH